MNDTISVEQTLAGDHQAFNSLITDYYADIYGMILSLVKEPELIILKYDSNPIFIMI
jgi:hypothetical protein